jgi:cytochrome bd-type quinol oxidase subunit 2|tara:strand:+ start:726 stop:1073 length:348 start_codon:yes stop_codon:yes gene_type:complete
MANTFKVVTKANVTSADVIYTVAGSTTTVVLGLILGNTTSGATTATVSLGSDTSGRAGNNDEANQTVELVTSVSIPGNSSLELMSGNKIVMETTDTLSVTAGASTDVVLSIMEIT